LGETHRRLLSYGSCIFPESTERHERAFKASPNAPPLCWTFICGTALVEHVLIHSSVSVLACIVSSSELIGLLLNMGAHSSKVDILVNNNKVYITLPMFMVHGDRKKLRNQQLEYLEGLKWDEIIAGYNFRPALESFSDALRHWDYGELQANQFWAWKIEPYLFVIRPSSTVDEVAIDQSNAAIQFFIDFRTGVGYRRADNGNSISIAYDTKYRLSALRVAAPAAATPSATTTPTTSAAAPAPAGYAPVPTGAVQGFDGVRGTVILYLKDGPGARPTPPPSVSHSRPLV